MSWLEITPREIQKGFRRDEFGEIGESLIPDPILEWYGVLSEALSDFKEDINIDTDKEQN